jgi:hypothetical protein
MGLKNITLVAIRRFTPSAAPPLPSNALYVEALAPFRADRRQPLLWDYFSVARQPSRAMDLLAKTARHITNASKGHQRRLRSKR